MLVYAIVDVSKFRGYDEEEHRPLSNWGSSTWVAVDFSEILKNPERCTFYVLRMTLSVLINISSILLIIIDAVCLVVSGVVRCILSRIA